MRIGRGRRRFSPLQCLSPSLSQNPKQIDMAHTPPRAQAGKEGDFIPYNASLPLSPKPQTNRQGSYPTSCLAIEAKKKKRRRQALRATLRRLPSGCLATLPL